MDVAVEKEKERGKEKAKAVRKGKGKGKGKPDGKGKGKAKGKGKSSWFEGYCNICGKYGHKASDCWHKDKNAMQVDAVTDKNTSQPPQLALTDGKKADGVNAIWTFGGEGPDRATSQREEWIF